MSKKYLPGLLVLFVGLDLAFAFWQNYHFPLDGDLVAIVLPAPWYTQVLHDPFGWAVLTKNEVYGGTNRFFAHAAMGLYWKQVPRLLHYFTNPINSLYVASALFTTATQALILFTLAAAVRLGPAGRPGRAGFWVAAALMAPLFQTAGFYGQMGVTDRAVTYTFFYAFPMALLLLLLYPFHRAACQRRALRLPPLSVALLVLLMVAVAFNGPIATAAVGVLLLGIGARWAWGRWTRRRPGAEAAAGAEWLSGQALGLLAVLAALCLYSLYIGRNNSENSHDHTLGQLYRLLPVGVYQQLFHQPGLPILLVMLLVNARLVRRLAAPSAERQRVLNTLRWVGLFAVVYLALLPLGGYRSYRPYLLRNDSILPVVLGLIFAYGQSAYFLLSQLRGPARRVYLGAVLLVAAAFTLVDKASPLPSDNGCERWALDQLARSPAPVVHLSPSCNVLSWGPVADYHQSEVPAEMLRYWGVTDRKKRYYQQ